MIRGPKIKLTLERYTTKPDGGGGSTKAWSRVADIRGVLTFIWADERVRADKETLHNRFHFWCDWKEGLDITTKDEFSRYGMTARYRIIYPDNILEKDKMLKIDLIQIR